MGAALSSAGGGTRPSNRGKVLPIAHLGFAMAQPRPILDTHIHLFQVTRPGGVPWPTPEFVGLYKDTLPGHYEAVARPLGIVGAGIVEASPLASDTRWVLDQIAGNPSFPFYVAQIEIGAPAFAAELAALSGEPRVVGVRAFLWNPPMTLAPEQLRDVQALERQGFTLDLISRGGFNPKAKIVELARAAPRLRIIIDHLGGAKGDTVDPAWEADMRQLAALANVSVKWSSFFDMWNPREDEKQPWSAPTDLASYRAHFDVLFDAFGPERLLFGSNWPVVTLGGTLAGAIGLAEAYLAPLGTKVRDQVMHENARAFYRRLPPG